MLLIKHYQTKQYYATSLTHDHLKSLVGYEVDPTKITQYFPHQACMPDSNVIEPHPTQWIAEPEALKQISQYCAKFGHEFHRVTLTPVRYSVSRLSIDSLSLNNADEETHADYPATIEILPEHAELFHQQSTGELDSEQQSAVNSLVIAMIREALATGKINVPSNVAVFDVAEGCWSIPVAGETSTGFVIVCYESD